MERLSRFFANAGTIGSLQSLVITIFLGLSLTGDLRSGLWIYTVPTVLGILLLTYCARGVLVEHPGRTQVSMNCVAFVAILTSILGRNFFVAGDPTTFRIGITVFLATYLSCYFWFLSDENIIRQ